MDITKEFFENALKEINVSKNITENFLKCIYAFYLAQNDIKYIGRSKINDFTTFTKVFEVYLDTPITKGTTLQEMLMNQKPVNIDNIIKNTINYFNNLFKV